MFPSSKPLSYLQRYQLLQLCKVIFACLFIAAKVLLWFVGAVLAFAAILTSYEKHTACHRHRHH